MSHTMIKPPPPPRRKINTPEASEESSRSNSNASNVSLATSEEKDQPENEQAFVQRRRNNQPAPLPKPINNIKSLEEPITRTEFRQSKLRLSAIIHDPMHDSTLVRGTTSASQTIDSLSLDFSSTPKKSSKSHTNPIEPSKPRTLPKSHASGEVSLPHNGNIPPPPAVIGPPPLPAVVGPPPRVNKKPITPLQPGRGIPPQIPNSPGPIKKVNLDGPVHVEASDWYPLVQLYLRNDFLLAKATIKAGSTLDLESLAASLVNIYCATKRIFEFLIPLIEAEVNSTESASTLFRGNCIASKALSSYSFFIGKAFLKKVLYQPIKQVIEFSNSLEVNPAKLPSDFPTPIEEHQENLRKVAQNFIDSIIGSLNICPMVLRKICYELRIKIADKYPESMYTVIGGFYFLRFFCPAITSPDNYQIIDESISEKARRGLVLISKIVQNIGNGVEFGKKESYMIPLNDVISNNIPRVNQLFDQIAQQLDFDARIKPIRIALSDPLLQKLHSYIFRFHCKILHEIAEQEKERGFPLGSEGKQFIDILHVMGVPTLIEASLSPAEIKSIAKSIKKEKKKFEVPL